MKTAYSIPTPSNHGEMTGPPPKRGSRRVRKTKKVAEPDTAGIPIAIIDDDESDVTQVADQAKLDALVEKCS